MPAANMSAIAEKRAQLAERHAALVNEYNAVQARLNVLANEVLKTQGAIEVLDELAPQAAGNGVVAPA